MSIWTGENWGKYDIHSGKYELVDMKDIQLQMKNFCILRPYVLRLEDCQCSLNMGWVFTIWWGISMTRWVAISQYQLFIPFLPLDGITKISHISPFTARLCKVFGCPDSAVDVALLRAEWGSKVFGTKEQTCFWVNLKYRNLLGNVDVSALTLTSSSEANSGSSITPMKWSGIPSLDSSPSSSVSAPTSYPLPGSEVSDAGFFIKSLSCWTHGDLDAVGLFCHILRDWIH